jgi:acyl-CoA synthetase (NDP forming)
MLRAVATKPLEATDMDKFFHPSSVVVIGASNAASNLGATICKTLGEDVGYAGRVFAINRAGEDVYTAKGYSRLDDIDAPIELAVIITPAFVVPGFVRKCGEKGIRNIIIESSGFSEQGEEGKRLQCEIDEAARLYQIRIIGPNCLGTLDNINRFCCMYGGNELATRSVKHPGRVSFIVQSGGVGTLMVERLMEDVSGINKIVSLGNRSDLDEADFIDYFDTDRTSVIALYLESVKDGRKLMQSVRRTKKPVLVYKSGNSEAGRAAAMSHTAGMAQNDAVFDGACKQAGMIRLRTPEEMYLLPKMLTEMPLLSGNRIAVFTNSGAFGTIGADMLARTNLVMAPFSEAMKTKLKNIPGVFNAENPVDIGPAPADVYLEIYKVLLEADEIDGILHTVSMWRDYVADVMETLLHLCWKHQKPAAMHAFNAAERLRVAQLERRLPLFGAAEEAVRALVVSYHHYLALQKKEQLLWTK